MYSSSETLPLRNAVTTSRAFTSRFSCAAIDRIILIESYLMTGE